MKEQCAGDPELYEEIVSLLAADEKVHNLLDGLAIDTLTPQEGLSLEGETIANYKIIRKIASGGMGAVYLAERSDGHFDRSVALKVIKKGMDSEQILKRFKRERQILARLQHPNIARLFDAGITKDGRPYFTMEYIDGLPIDEYCDQNKLNIKKRLELFQTVCEAVGYAHRNLIVHRDLKPGNIFITTEGKVKLLDFGIAALLNETDEGGQITKVGQQVLTPEYAAPEQFKGGQTSVSSDIYQLGVVLYELLNGSRPYDFFDLTLSDIEKKLVEQEPKKLTGLEINRIGKIAQNRNSSVSEIKKTLRGDLEIICLKALRKEADSRYLSIDAFQDDIKRYLTLKPVLARKGTFRYKTQKFIIRNKVGVTGFTIILVAFFSIILFYTGALKKERDKAHDEALKAAQVSSFLIDIFKVADPAVSKGETITAREILERGRQNIESRLQQQPLLQAKMLNVLGEVYGKLAMFDTAAVLLEKALTLRQDNLDSFNAEIAETMSGLAVVYLETGAYEKAGKLLDQAFSIIDNKNLVAEKADVLNLKGRFHQYHREYKKAEPFFRESLQMNIGLFGEHHDIVASGYNDLALNMKRQGNYEESEKLQRKAIAIKTAIFGSESSELSTEYFNLAKLLHLRDDFEQADSLFNRALKMDRKILGNRHSDLAKVLTSYSFLKKDMRQLDEAQKLISEAYLINLGLFGEKHHSVASNLDFKARLLRYSKKYDQSLVLHKKALGMKKAVWGERHPSVANTINNIGRVYDAMGDYKSAEKYYQDAMEMIYAIQGKDDPEGATMLHNLAMVVYDQKDYPRAEKIMQESLDAQSRLHHKSHRRVLGEMESLAMVYIKQQKFKKAEDLYREVLSRREVKLEPRHRYVGRAKSNLGNILLLQKKYDKAENNLLSAFEILKEVSGLKDGYTQTCIERLSELYTLINQPKKKARFDSLLSTN